MDMGKYRDKAQEFALNNNKKNIQIILIIMCVCLSAYNFYIFSLTMIPIMKSVFVQVCKQVRTNALKK